MKWDDNKIFVTKVILAAITVVSSIFQIIVKYYEPDNVLTFNSKHHGVPDWFSWMTIILSIGAPIGYIVIDSCKKRIFKEKMVVIKGRIRSGTRSATGNIAKQKEYIKEFFPDIETYFNGTINLLLETPFNIYKPDVVTPPLEWSPNFHEKFGFLKIKFESIPKQTSMPLDALIYIPYKSPHFENPFYKEIMLKTKIDLTGIEFCKIYIDKHCRKSVVYTID